MAERVQPMVTVRDLRADDFAAVVAIDAAHTGTAKPAYWRRIFDDYIGASRETIGLAVDGDGGLVGYLFGEARAVEFGSEPCGWIFAVGVVEPAMRVGVATALLDAALARFRAQGMTSVRTMVRRNDVPVLSFFRARGFVGGSFVQLERELE